MLEQLVKSGASVEWIVVGMLVYILFRVFESWRQGKVLKESKPCPLTVEDVELIRRTLKPDDEGLASPRQCVLADQLCRRKLLHDFRDADDES